MMVKLASLGVWGLAFVSICLSAGAQLLMKIGMSSDEIKTHSGEMSLSLMMAVLLNPHVVAGLACYALSAALWLAVLSRMPLSMAYPLVAMAIVMVVLASAVLLGEPLPTGRIVGSTLIVIGVAAIGLSG